MFKAINAFLEKTKKNNLALFHFIVTSFLALMFFTFGFLVGYKVTSRADKMVDMEQNGQK